MSVIDRIIDGEAEIIFNPADDMIVEEDDFLLILSETLLVRLVPMKESGGQYMREQKRIQQQAETVVSQNKSYGLELNDLPLVSGNLD